MCMDGTFHDAVEDIDALPSAEEPATADGRCGKKEEEEGDEEAEAGDQNLDAETLKAVRRERKKAKKALKKAAKAAEGGGSDVQPMSNGNGAAKVPEMEKVEVVPHTVPAAPSGEEGGEAISAAAKKRRKKKKALTSSAGQHDEPDEEGGGADEAEVGRNGPSAPPPLVAQPVTPEPPRSPPPREAKGASASADYDVDPTTPPTPSAPLVQGQRALSKAIVVDLQADFAPAGAGDASGTVGETCGGVSTLGTEWHPSLPEARLFNLCGPHIKHATGKGDCKGEDKSLVAQNNVWTVPSIQGVLIAWEGIMAIDTNE